MTASRPTESEILAWQAECDGFYPPNALEAPIGQQRAWYDALCGAFDRPRPATVAVHDAPLGARRLPARRYRPATPVSDAVLLWFHGGGFVLGSLDSHDAILAEIADGAGVELVSLDYRLLPEHPFPAAAEDARDALDATLAEGRPVVVAGDSAGGTLAASLAIEARGDGVTGLAGQVLVYPALGGDIDAGSFIEMANAPGLTTADVRHYRALLAAPEDDTRAHPLAARSFAGLPPAYVTAARFDPLRDDARAYAARLAEAGVDVRFREEPQMVHSWLRARHASPGASAGFAALVDGVRWLAGHPFEPTVRTAAR